MSQTDTTNSTITVQEATTAEAKAAEVATPVVTPVVTFPPEAEYPLILSGPSGVGKGTLVEKLFKDFPDTFIKKVSHTTRAPRAGEVHGRSYHFVTEEQFVADIKENKFLEYALTHGRYYGTQYSSVKQIQGQGKIVLLELDVEGMRIVKERNDVVPSEEAMKYHNIWISPPDYTVLLGRLRGRGSETDESIQLRLATAAKERSLVESHKELFETTIVNDDLEECYINLKKHIASIYPAYKKILFPEPSVTVEVAKESEKVSSPVAIGVVEEILSPSSSEAESKVNM